MKVNGIEVGNTPDEMLAALAKRSGGIPDFAKQALVELAGFDKGVVERADRYARGMNMKTEIKQLEREIDAASAAYYNKGKSKLTDAAFDKLVARLATIDPKNSRVTGGKIGAVVDSAIAKVKLPVKMGSLHKATPSTLGDWLSSLPKEARYWLSPKFDGLAGLLHYRDGVLVAAYTRGDGEIGRNVTAAARHIVGVPAQLRKSKVKSALYSHKSDLYFVGEFVMHNSIFKQNHLNWITAGKSYATPRNLVVGMLNTIKPRVKTLNDMTFIAVRVIAKPAFDWKHQQYLAMAEWGLVTGINPTRPGKSGFADPSKQIKGFTVDNAKDLTEQSVKKLMATWAKQIDIGMDGLVIEVQQHDIAHQLGYETSSLNPAWARAIKPEREDQQTLHGTLHPTEPVIWNYSYRRLYKPTLQLAKPLNFGGVLVKHASVNNADQVDRWGLGKGAVVKMVRSGDVIPYCMGVVKRAKPALPSKCFYCHSKLAWSNVDLYCPNNKCSGQAIQLLKRFFAVINVDHVAGGVIEQLVDAGYDTVPKLLKAEARDLAKLDGWGQTKATKVANGLRNCLTGVELPTLMKASGFFANELSGLGESKLRKIVEHFGEHKVLNQVIPLAQFNFAGFTPKSGQIFNDGMDKFDPFYQALTKALGRTKVHAGPAKPQSQKLVKVVAAFTGFRDADLAKLIVQHGGKASDGLTKETTVLFAKKDSAKTIKAKQRNIPVIAANQAAAWVNKRLGK